jgi:iron(III) transport system permease protein
LEISPTPINKRGTAGISGLGWRVLLFSASAALATPLLIILANLLQPYSPSWQHLFDTVLQDYVLNSLALMIGVGIGTLFLGVGAAWVTAMCDFPGRKFLSWAFLLPLSMPAYIIAYTYTGILDFSGPLQTSLRNIFGWQFGDYYFPEIRSLGGAICMLSLVLYPYVYMLVRVAFLEQSTAVLEASRTLGRKPLATFFMVALPLARPAIVAGVSLALMETLADYGTVAYFGVSAFTTGIFRTWYGLGELTTAAQLCAFLMIFVLTLMVAERWSRQRLRFHKNSAQKKLVRIKLRGWRASLATVLSLTVVLCGFAIPAFQLLVWSLNHWQQSINNGFLTLLLNSFSLAAMASICCLVLAMFFAYARRISASGVQIGAINIASLGYAVPGTVIAVGIIIPAAWLDNHIDAFSRAWFDHPTGLILSGTLGVLVFAYLVRFLSVALNTVDAGLNSIKSNIDESARSLGASGSMIVRRVHLPILKTSLLTALLLVFVEVLKELPTTLILRPFNFNTLAVRTYELASDERLMDAALPALSIVIIGLLPIMIITKSILNERSNHA